MSNQCKFCGKDCKNVFCSISCRNKFWNPSIKKGKKVNNNINRKERIIEVRTCKCGNQFQVEGTLKQLNSSKVRKFCSVSCSNSKKHSAETISKIRKGLKRYVSNNLVLVTKYCKHCNIPLKHKTRSKYCNKDCKDAIHDIRYPNKNLKHEYRLKCKFKFNPFKYSNILDVSLLKTNGFYSPSNKKNNLNGASLDHKYSIMDGFDNNVDPYYMSHIMNCEILIHSSNISKGRKSKITLEELKNLVDEFDRNNGVLV